ncbi:hypothetical protein AJ88_08650 [Mesorhizobium amorphae CCBAU 01583]|nr:hypothetical protein AJ88_08650 [Mesorhizobium amorphae CCBAU 01583]
MRTQARQVYAFAVAKARGWTGPADRLISHGIDFMAGKGRTDSGGWVRTLNVDGSVADSAEDAYDHSCVLLALAHAHMSGNPDALLLGEETFAFLDAHLEDERMTGFLETSSGEGERRSTRICICSRPSSPGIRRPASAPICAAQHASSTFSAAISSTRKAGRWANISTGNGSRPPARKASGPNLAIISNGPRCWSISPPAAARPS